MKKISIFIVVAALFVTMAFFGLSCKQAATTETAAAETTASNLAGTTIKYLGTTELENNMIQAVIPDFEKETGIKVELELIALGDEMQKARLELSKGSPDYDVVEISTYDNSVYYSNDWLANLDDLEKQVGPSFNRDTFIPGLLKKVGQLNGITYGLPILFCCNGPLEYRKDLINKQEEKDAFKQKYGYDLVPPTTWSQFYDVAEFFTRDTNDDGKIDFYGCAMVLDAGGAIWDQWILRYITGDVEKDASATYNYLFTDDLQPRFNSKAGVKAIEDIKKLYDKGYIYPGSLSMGWSQIVEPMRTGNCFMAYMWAETIVPSMLAENSEFAKDLAWSPLPIDVTPRMEIGAWLFTINKNSKNKEAAYKFIQWLTTEDTEVKLINAGKGFKMPARQKNFDNPDLLKGYEFYEEIKKMLASYELLPEIFVPEVDIIQQNLNVDLQRVVAGEKTGQQALDDTAKAIVKGLTEAGAYERIKK